MAGFMKSAMSYLGMSDVAEDDDDFTDEADGTETSFDSDHSVTPLASTPTTSSASAASSREQSNPFQGGRVSRITTIHPKSYEDAQLVGRAIRDGIPVVLNLTGVAESVAYRIVDFSAGVGFHRTCHSACVPAEPGPGEHQGGGAAGSERRPRSFRRLTSFIHLSPSTGLVAARGGRNACNAFMQPILM